ncbi:MAG TPA: hypothetical protein VHB45_01200 [Alloacidobacterium sp.]|nr:hypothetical protein [Alloacidobacterium sp.]
MVETFYKTDNPQAASALDAEYYELSLLSDPNGTGRYFVKEHHGWWDEQAKQARHNIVVLSPEDGFDDYEDALKVYNAQKQHLAEIGFIHVLSPDMYGESEKGYNYERLQVPAQKSNQ